MDLRFRYLIALGSNTGDRFQMLKDARYHIEHSIGPILAHASIYETEPMGAADSLFLNTALISASNLPPVEVMAELLAIEQRLGRIRTEKWGNRTIDLDVLLCQEKKANGTHSPIILQSPTLTLPHPEMLKRSFVMLPAAEVASDWQHPLAHVCLGDALVANFPANELQGAKRFS